MVGLWLVIQMAGYAMPRGRLTQEWLDLCAHWHSLGTPGVKAAPAGGIEWTRYLTRQNHLSMHVIGMGWERIAQQHLGIRMQWVSIELTPRRSWSCRRRFMTWARIDTSSADTGSSSRIQSGLVVRARARATRCRWPPESSCG